MNNKWRAIQVLLYITLFSCYSMVLCQNKDTSLVISAATYSLNRDKSIKFNCNVINDNVFKKAFSLNGEDEYINLGNQILNSNFTASFWFSSGNLLGNNATLLSIGELYWLRTTTKREIQFTQPNILDQNTQNLALTKGVWYQLTLVVNGSVALI